MGQQAHLGQSRGHTWICPRSLESSPSCPAHLPKGWPMLLGPCSSLGCAELVHLPPLALYEQNSLYAHAKFIFESERHQSYVDIEEYFQQNHSPSLATWCLKFWIDLSNTFIWNVTFPIVLQRRGLCLP